MTCSRIAEHLLRELQRRGKKHGAVTMYFSD